MSELTDHLSSALLEERDYANAAFGAMHRSHLRLLEVLGKMEQRVAALELKTETRTSDFDPEKLTGDQINGLAAKLADPLWDHELEEKVDSRIADALSELEVELDDLELSVSVDSVSARITGKP